mgnify:CR=1 FL=1
MSEIRSRMISNPELRLSEDGKRIGGYAARYNVMAKPGLGWDEIIERGAFDVSLEAGDDVVALFNHDPNQILGRRDAGTLRLSTDEQGLRFEADLPNTPTGEMVRELVQRGDLREMSFGFVVQDDTWTNTDGQRVRHLTKLSLRDVSVVTEAQYPQTSVSLRTNNMQNNQELYTELRNLTSQAHAILDQEDRNAEDQQKLDRLFNRVDEIESTINEQRNAARLEKAEAALDTPTRSAVTRATSTPTHDSDEYRSAFMSYLRSGDRNELRAMNITNDGAVVPTDLERTLVEKLDALSVIRQYATVYNWDSNRDVPVEDAIGSAGWTAEEGTITPADATFGTSIEFRAYKATAAVRVSNELLEDSLAVNMTQYLGNILGRRFATLLEDAYCEGDGSSKPSGLIPNCGVAGTTHTCGSGDVTFGAVVADDIIDTVHKLSPQYRAGARWVMTDSMLKAARQMKDSDGRYLWQVPEMNADIRAGIPGLLYGYPVVVIDDAYGPAEAASTRAVIFGDLSNFWIADRGQTSMLMDPYTNALTGQVDMVAYRRTDSHVVLPEAFSVLKLAAS